LRVSFGPRFAASHRTCVSYLLYSQGSALHQRPVHAECARVHGTAQFTRTACTCTCSSHHRSSSSSCSCSCSRSSSSSSYTCACCVLRLRLMWCIPRAQHRNRMSAVVPPTTTARVPLHDARRTLLHAPRHNGLASDANQAAIRHSMPCVHAQAHSGTARNDALSGRLLSWEACACACACAERTFGRAITACEQRIEQWISMLVPCQPPGTAKNSFTKSLRPAGTTRAPTA
jgi:hypothetical protein